MPNIVVFMWSTANFDNGLQLCQILWYSCVQQAVLQAAAALQAERARAEAAKADRQAATDRKRERLKAAFLKRQLEQKKTGKQG